MQQDAELKVEIEIETNQWDVRGIIADVGCHRRILDTQSVYWIKSIRAVPTCSLFRFEKLICWKVYIEWNELKNEERGEKSLLMLKHINLREESSCSTSHDLWFAQLVCCTRNECGMTTLMLVRAVWYTQNEERDYKLSFLVPSWI